MTMKTYRSHTVAATLIAAIATTLITGALVESLDPSKIFRREAAAPESPAVALDRRAEPRGEPKA
jgi:hypothetical protein